MPTAARRAAATKSTAAKAEEKVEEAPKKETDSAKRNRLRNEAERMVINNHRDEFNQVATDLFAKNGLVFHRRLTDEERAAKEIADKLNQFPQLRGLFAPVGALHAADQQVLAEPGGPLEAFRHADHDGLTESEAHVDFPGDIPPSVTAYYSDPFEPSVDVEHREGE
ncbi:hypothetical protein PBI_BEAGLE_97 [Arthrobacter phage Beagle]|nr:hypothetical protein PBI_BEAGLE_97 [Arthrobacter phage Beagle]QOP66844.1 hypothetical protein SEA_ODYSSEY395_95 [Arthrobacter phage Odyssey395]